MISLDDFDTILEIIADALRESGMKQSDIDDIIENVIKNSKLERILSNSYRQQ